MQYAILTLQEFSNASQFFRSVSQTPAQATGFITIGKQLAELKLTATNLRQLVPIPETERPYIGGIANLSVYQVWLVGKQMEPVFLGVFDVPLFGQGELYVTFDPHNVNDCGKPLFKHDWLLITAGDERKLGRWCEDATTAVLYGAIADTQQCHTECKPPWELFEQRGSYYKDYEEYESELDWLDEDEELPSLTEE